MAWPSIEGCVAVVWPSVDVDGGGDGNVGGMAVAMSATVERWCWCCLVAVVWQSSVGYVAVMVLWQRWLSCNHSGGGVAVAIDAADELRMQRLQFDDDDGTTGMRYAS